MLLEDVYKELTIFFWNHPRALDHNYIPIVPDHNTFYETFNRMNKSWLERETTTRNNLEAYWWHSEVGR